jgi:GntR family transcriptional regulator
MRAARRVPAGRKGNGEAMLRDKAIPLYYQLETILRNKITSGEYAPEAPLPSEDTLADEYRVSRITVRQALAALEQDGLVLRRRGKGTFVSAEARAVGLPRYTGSIEDLMLMGLRTATEVLDAAWIDPPEHIRERLRSAGDKVLRIEKVRRLEGRPFSYVLNYLPPAVGEKLPLELVKTKPMLMILEEELGIRLSEADQAVQATIADAAIAPLLDIRVGDPLLNSERIVYDVRKRPVEYVSSLYRADQYAFTMKLKRRRSARSARWGAA